jgi:hypothetical protein
MNKTAEHFFLSRSRSEEASGIVGPFVPSRPMATGLSDDWMP